MDPAGKFIYQPNNTGTFDIYSINQTTGALSLAGSSRAPSVGPFTAITSDGRFLINMGSNLIETLSIDAAGNLAVVQPTIVTGGAAPGVDGQLAVSADNQLVYVLNQGNVAIFHLDTHGMLAPVTGSPFATDARATAFSLAPDGLHLYVAFLNSNETAVKGFIFDPAAATLTPIAGAVIADNAATVTLDPSGRFAYIGHFPAVPGELSTYSVDPSTGTLTLISQTAQPIGGSSLTMVAVH
jgi:6-phosphogluconolactonase (cycloisomerase 2 family)